MAVDEQAAGPGTLFASALQFDVRLGEPEENLARALSLLDRIGPERPHVALLPEVFTSNFTFRKAAEIVSFSAKALETLAGRARQQGIAIAGSIIEKASDAAAAEGFYSNRAFFLDEKGERRTSYAKRHLIRIAHEHVFYEPGKASPPPLIQWQGIQVAMAICYDIRFPEWIGRLAFAGARLLLVPAQWPSERLSHWQTLLKARAIENQFFVVSCNRTGALDGVQFPGASEILDPWGNTLAGGGSEDPAVVTARLNLSEVDAIRKRLCAFSERRSEETGGA